MKSLLGSVICIMAVLLSGAISHAQDWPQWRGVNRDAKAVGFQAPATWPNELKKKWSVNVGDGVATPALVGDRLYVFARQQSDEVMLCLNANDHKEIWRDKYEAPAPRRPADYFAGPRSSPTVVDGKIVTLGASGTLSCLDAATGKVIWRKNDFKGSVPRFFTSCSPVVADGLCFVQLGGEDAGAVVAYELANGNQKWKWSGDGTAYASPTLLSAGSQKVVVAETAGNVVALSAVDGKLLWKVEFSPAGQRQIYNACSPVVDGQTIVISGAGGRGTKAFTIEKKGDELTAREAWSNTENGVQFNSPVVKNGNVFGLTADDKLFCIDGKTGKTAWRADFPGTRRWRGYGSVVDAGSVLFALNPNGRLRVFQPTEKEYKQLAEYTVSSGDTFAYPVISGSRIFIKDKESLTLWTVD